MEKCIIVFVFMNISKHLNDVMMNSTLLCMGFVLFTHNWSVKTMTRQ